jgi:NAD(P)-dependent dehydrogenase (short-subunit alcohol dehydrogenase family)
MRKVFITGGAHGIGQAIVEALLTQDAENLWQKKR